MKVSVITPMYNCEKFISETIESVPVSYTHLKYVAVYNEESAQKLKNMIPSDINIEVLSGMEGLKTISSLPEIDVLLTAIVGMIGLVPTLEAIKHKKDIALANKETLVCAGKLVMSEAKKNGVKILPVDSEHSCLLYTSC